MTNAKVLIIGLIILAVGILFMAPVVGIALPFVLPAVGPEVMGLSGVGIGLLVFGIILMIAGTKMIG